MAITIKSKASEKVIKEKLSQIPEKKKFQSSKYLGKLSLKSDPILVQKEIRSEWQ